MDFGSLIYFTLDPVCGDSHSHRAQWYHIYIYIYINTIIISASTCNNLISFHLYVYNDKFSPLHQLFLPTYSFDHSLFIILPFFLLQDAGS